MTCIIADIVNISSDLPCAKNTCKDNKDITTISLQIFAIMAELRM